MTRTLAVLLLAVAPVCSANSKYTETKTQTWPFAPGGHVEVRLKGGDVRVVPAADSNHIAIRYTVESDHKDFIGKVKADFEVNSSSAELRFKSPNNGSVSVELEVPAQSSVYIRVKGGDLTVSGIEGDQDVQTIGGDISLDLPPAAKFYRVDASTHFGDIDNSPFGKPKGWLGAKIHFRGDGKYKLHAHTFAGDIRFSTLSASR
jgi:hypothetical protein